MTPDKIRFCTLCGLRGRAAYSGRCYNCLAALKKQYRQRNPERAKAQQAKDWKKQKARLAMQREQKYG